MTDKKTTSKKKAKAKQDTVTFREQKYTVLEEANGKLMLTDGIIHFWAKAEECERD